MSREYWTESVEASFNDAGIAATKEQIENVAGDMEICHEQYGMVSGDEVASQNFHAAREQEIANLRRELYNEREKTICHTCNGSGTITVNGPCHSASSQCWKCNGQGRR